MGSVLDSNPQPEVHRVETVNDTTAQSCNISPDHTRVSSVKHSTKTQPVPAPSLPIRTGLDNILLSSANSTWEDKLSQTPVIHAASKIVEVPSTTQSQATVKPHRRKVYRCMIQKNLH